MEKERFMPLFFICRGQIRKGSPPRDSPLSGGNEPKQKHVSKMEI
jgi:hypothetical protein